MSRNYDSEIPVYVPKSAVSCLDNIVSFLQVVRYFIIPGVVAQIFNPSTEMAEARRFL